MNPPIPLVAGRFRSGQYAGVGFFEEIAAVMPRRFVGLAGLGDCPAGLYPNLANPGFCTNIPTAQQNPTGDYSAPVPIAAAEPAPVNAAIVEANNAARFGLQLTPDRATQEALAAEAIAQGAKRGVPVSCEIVHNTAPAMDNLPASDLWQALCTVAGAPDRQSAAQLIRSGGFQTYATNNNITLTSPAPAAPSSPSSSSSTASTSTGAPIPASAGSGFDPSTLLADATGFVTPFADQLGIPSWALLAAAGLAFYVIGGKR